MMFDDDNSDDVIGIFYFFQPLNIQIHLVYVNKVHNDVILGLELWEDNKPILARRWITNGVSI